MKATMIGAFDSINIKNTMVFTERHHKSQRGKIMPQLERHYLQSVSPKNS